MGRHSNRPTVRAVAAPPPSKSKETTMTLWRWLLVGFLALWVLGTGVGLAKMWPGDQKPNIAPEFYTSFNLGHKQVGGTVLFVQPGACSAAETGTLFDTAPRVVLGAPEECEWYIIEISEGAGAGMRTLIINSNQPGEPTLEQGDKILLLESEGENGAPLYAFSDLERTMPLLSWGILIALVIIACALLRGVRALIGLLITMLVVVFFTLPVLLLGAPPISTAVVSGATILLAVVVLVHGFNWKSASALGGTLIALGIAAWLASVAIDNNHLRGLGDEDNLSIILYLPDVSVRGLMLCGFIIGALGVLNDVAISQSSTVNELAELDPEAGPMRIFVGAMKVGRDHISSMVYTLVLTYTGASLPLLLLLTISERPLLQTLTSDTVATEILRSGIGALALTLAVPITTLIAAFTVPESSRR
ncbi:putative multitransmembrane protein [Corynebacterium mustelae]|uniref:Putative multitransmembrane protein n=1 Tax=Corynebacterium mustelae TaxID=571915 RepID=A0A0G3H7D1_9CORY|nr:YibE/F family protein [Corynebacterium mustelae]AKK07077.1 putative multitransmembrane protein [Corynebacterium mustelae]